MGAAPESSAETSRLRDAVLDSALRALRGAEHHLSPFPHLHVRGFFPDEVYRRMLTDLPAPELYRPDNPYKHAREDGTSTRDVFGLDERNLARLTGDPRELWRGITDALHAEALGIEVFRSLGAKPATALHPRPGLTRDLPGYEILPHPDTRAKVVTLQLYLTEASASRDLGTTLYRRRLWKLENLRSPRRMYEGVEDVPYEPNTGYAFVVGRRTWHGRERLPPSAEVRNSLILFYYDDPSRGW